MFRHVRLAAGLTLAALTPAHASVFVDPLGGAGMASNHPVLRAQMAAPPDARLLAALAAIGLAAPWLTPRRRRTCRSAGMRDAVAARAR